MAGMAGINSGRGHLTEPGAGERPGGETRKTHMAGVSPPPAGNIGWSETGKHIPYNYHYSGAGLRADGGMWWTFAIFSERIRLNSDRHGFHFIYKGVFPNCTRKVHLCQDSNDPNFSILLQNREVGAHSAGFFMVVYGCGWSHCAPW